MKVLVTYSTIEYQKKANFLAKTAKVIAGFDKVLSYTDNDIDNDFKKTYSSILKHEKGAGFWLWKPYILMKAISAVQYNDYIFYADAASFFIGKIDILINVMEDNNQEIMAFELPLLERQWSKMELFFNMNMPFKLYGDTNQIGASFILIKKTKKNEIFIKDYLRYSSLSENIMDQPLDLQLQDCNFISHRNDQSIFSLLYKKYNLKPFRDPTQYGEFSTKYSGIGYFQYEFNKLYKLDNGREFRVHKLNEEYGAIILHVRLSNIFRCLITYVIQKILIKVK